MPIQSMDQLIAAFSGGKTFRTDWNRNTLPIGVQAAGLWYDLSQGAGNPSINSNIGSSANLVQQNTSETTSLTAASAASGSSIAGTVFTDTTHGSGRFTVGMQLTGAGIVNGTFITSLGTGTGANNGGTYNVNISQTVTAQTITGTGAANSFGHGGGVSPDVKHIVNVSAFSAAPTTMPCVLMLVDQLAQFTITSVTTTGLQNFTGQSAWPRYADGRGVRAFLTPSVPMGAGSPSVQLTYTNPSAAAGRTTPATPSLPIINSVSPVGQVSYTGTGVGKYGPFIPLQNSDNGLTSIQSINFSASMSSGVMNLIIAKPLLVLPLTTQGVAAERDLLNQLPSLPRVFDGANLQWLMYAGAATPVNSAFYGAFDTVWG